MISLQKTVLGLVARTLVRWSSAVSARLDAAGSPADAGGPPPHWREASQPKPPAEWLALVREHAPQLLEPDGEGVIDWMADDALLDAMLPAGETEPVEPAGEGRHRTPAKTRASRDGQAPGAQGMPVTYRTPDAARPLRLHVVSAEAAATTTVVARVVSRARKPARLRFAGESAAGRHEVQPAEVTAGAHGEVAVQQVTPARGTDATAHDEFGVANRQTTSSNVVATLLPPREPRAASTAHRLMRRLRTTFTNRRSESVGVEVASVQAAAHERPDVKAVVARGRRRTLRHILARRADVPTVSIAQASTATATTVETYPSAALPPAGVRVASHRFPSLLDDAPALPTFDPREAERRRRLAAEQEGRAWNA
jgi:hypothetical protein